MVVVTVPLNCALRAIVRCMSEMAVETGLGRDVVALQAAELADFVSLGILRAVFISTENELLLAAVVAF